MKVIRIGVFETNSSSSHSISIYKWKAPEKKNIPLNTTLHVDGSISGITEITDELGKLNYIVAMLASIVEDEIEYKSPFESVITSKRFTWLKELIQEKCNTEIVYDMADTYFPYYETVYDDGRSIPKVLECDVDNELEFKTRIAEIIFTDDIVIEDKENEY